MEGIITALITPFKNNEVDFASLKKLIRLQLDQEIDGFVIHGTTSESPTTTEKEKEQIFSFIKSEVAGQVPLIVGTGTNCTQTSIQKSKLAQKWGAEALLLVVPYYNKPPQRGLKAHFGAIAQSVDIPTILYNVPTRTITSLELETIYDLSKSKKIIGIKEATGNLDFGKKIIQKVDSEFLVLSGDDKTSMGLAAIGGRGVIAVASHIIAKEMKKAYKKIKKDKQGEEALKKYEQNFELIDSLYLESNPIPVKYALYKMGVISSPELRLPLVELREDLRAQLEKNLTKAGLI